MAIREYIDGNGVRWEVWHIIPSGRYHRPPGAERRIQQVAFTGPNRRHAGFVLTPGLEAGWLCFQSVLGKRRLAPVPSDWQECSDEELAAYFERARPVKERVVELESEIGGPSHRSAPERREERLELA